MVNDAKVNESLSALSSSSYGVLLVIVFVQSIPLTSEGGFGIAVADGFWIAS